MSVAIFGQPSICMLKYSIVIIIIIGANSVYLMIQMNQQCKVCGEPAAGFHFGAFTCEGCKVGIMLQYPKIIY